MGQDVVINLVTQALTTGLEIALPILGVALVVGLLVSVFQAVTQIQEATLSFIPKILALAGTLVFAGPWMLGHIVAWTAQLYAGIPTLIAGS
jgi:flagellar biosynthetic protein FliQ